MRNKFKLLIKKLVSFVQTQNEVSDRKSREFEEQYIVPFLWWCAFGISVLCGFFIFLIEKIIEIIKRRIIKPIKSKIKAFLILYIYIKKDIRILFVEFKAWDKLNKSDKELLARDIVVHFFILSFLSTFFIFFINNLLNLITVSMVIDFIRLFVLYPIEIVECFFRDFYELVYANLYLDDSSIRKHRANSKARYLWDFIEFILESKIIAILVVAYFTLFNNNLDPRTRFMCLVGMTIYILFFN